MCNLFYAQGFVQEAGDRCRRDLEGSAVKPGVASDDSSVFYQVKVDVVKVEVHV